MGPAEDKAMSLQNLVTPCRGGGAIRQAAEVTGNIARAIGVVIATEDGVLLVGRPIHTRIVVVVVVYNRCVASEVVKIWDYAPSGDVRLREERHELGYGGVDPAGRNLVVRQRKTGRRVFDGWILDAYPRAGCRTEVADALIVERHSSDAAYTLRDARALVIEEVEQFVLLDRSTEAAAELILMILRTAQVVAVGEEVIGVEVVVAQVFEQQAVHRVGPALRIHRNNGTGTAAIFSRVRIGDDVEFLDDVDRGVRRLRAQFLHVLRECVVVDAVQDEIVLQ